MEDIYEMLINTDHYFFDLDGCIYYTDQPASGSNDLLAALRNDGKQVGFITNNSRSNSEEVALKLQNMGLHISANEIFTATELTGSYLKAQYGSLSVTVAGSKSLQDSIQKWGHTVRDIFTVDTVDMIVIGRDTEFSFDKLQKIISLIDHGAQIISTNCDMCHPGSTFKRVPETGALTAAVEAITGQTVQSVGKPNSFLYSAGLKYYGAKAETSMMVGDNLYTDILGANKAGMKSIWISGSGTNEVSEDVSVGKPDIVVHDMAELLSIYQKLKE